ncbi:hypothetical protein EVAR_97204_1 [Eumeta japonica]|uniref:Uncharacterized protein n=1 Tax=Eumeta variegata TaxID=151549 RepID=A0A4C1WI52_EUMVA|nr:hypothetical protein EVAR_97204_1 [Eumeta japonica]
MENSWSYIVRIDIDGIRQDSEKQPSFRSRSINLDPHAGQCGSGAVDDRRHLYGDDVCDLRLNVFLSINSSVMQDYHLRNDSKLSGRPYLLLTTKQECVGIELISSRSGDESSARGPLSVDNSHP